MTKEDGESPRNVRKIRLQKDKLYIMVLILFISPFYLNDFSSIYIKDWRWWLFIDYTAVKLFPLLIVIWLIRNKKMQPAEFGLITQSVFGFVIVFAGCAIIGTLIDQNAYELIKGLPGYASVGVMPVIKSPAWDWMDLTLGLLMVGVFEELIFRGYMYTFISRYSKSRTVIVLISATAFGCAHWSGGLHVLIVTSVVGAVFMIAYLKTRSVPAIMLAHFVVNFIDYAGIVPKSIFKFI